MHCTAVQSATKLRLFFIVFDEVCECLHTNAFEFTVIRNFGLDLNKPSQNVAIFTQVIVHKLQKDKY